MYVFFFLHCRLSFGRGSLLYCLEVNNNMYYCNVSFGLLFIYLTVEVMYLHVTEAIHNNAISF